MVVRWALARQPGLGTPFPPERVVPPTANPSSTAFSLILSAEGFVVNAFIMGQSIIVTVSLCLLSLLHLARSHVLMTLLHAGHSPACHFPAYLRHHIYMGRNTALARWLPRRGFQLRLDPRSSATLAVRLLPASACGTASFSL